MTHKPLHQLAKELMDETAPDFMLWLDMLGGPHSIFWQDRIMDEFKHPHRPVDPEWVSDAVEAIRAIEIDGKVAHGLEDALYLTVLKTIADGTCRQPTECAAAAITTQQLDFCRDAADPWYCND